MSSKNDENVTSVPPAFNLSSKMMTTTESYTTHDVITTETPVAMRSSFAVGVRIWLDTVTIDNDLQCFGITYIS